MDLQPQNFNNSGNAPTGQPQNNTDNSNPKKRYWKFVFGFLGIILLGFIIFPLAYNFYKDYEVKQGFENYFEAEKDYQDVLKNDTFGGKTPQETYEMFIGTLKTGNILDSAKFYFRDEDRIGAYKKFDQMQKDGSLANWIAELPNWSQMKEVEYWDKNKKEFDYQFIQEDDYTFYDEALQKNRTIPAGVREKAIVFELNKAVNIWKIYEL